MRKKIYIMKHIYFIDFENTNNQILDILHECTPKDSWYFIFYSDETQGPEWILRKAPEGMCVRFIPCENGKTNSLDFQLMAKVGQCTAIYRNARYIIVSNDKGYDGAIHMLQREGVRIFRESAPTGLVSHDKRKERQETFDRNPIYQIARQACNRAGCPRYTDLLYHRLKKLKNQDLKGKNILVEVHTIVQSTVKMKYTSDVYAELKPYYTKQQS